MTTSTASNADPTFDAPIQRKATRSNYLFVTNIRFVSMVGIVAVHSEAIPVHWHGGFLNVMFNQGWKFATVCFFLISGFLLGDRLEDASPVEYMKRRLRMTAMPWAIWAGLYGAMLMAIDVLARGSHMRSLHYHLNEVLFGSAYWFVPNILFSLATLLVFRRWLNTPWLGLVLGLSTVAHGINLYTTWWSDQRHTSAWAGFIFFLWAGYQLRRHIELFRTWVRRISWPTLVAASLFTYTAALGETIHLWHTHNPDFDFLSTLRISNLLYSLVMFVVLFKFERSIEPPGMDARKYTFGIYLVHSLFFAVVARALKLFLARLVGVTPLVFNDHIMDYINTPILRLGVQLTIFFVVYSCAWKTAAVLSRTRFSSTIGARE
jgi:Acyltransferase family